MLMPYIYAEGYLQHHIYILFCLPLGNGLYHGVVVDKKKTLRVADMQMQNLQTIGSVCRFL